MLQKLTDDEKLAATQSSASFVDEYRLGLSMAVRQESCR